MDAGTTAAVASHGGREADRRADVSGARNAVSFETVAAPGSRRDVNEEVILPLPAPLERLSPATTIRSTLIASSIRAIRRCERYDAYADTTAPATRLGSRRKSR
jgi:hypothetical protein